LHGKTLSLHAITQQLATTYRGSAAKAAGTAAGQWGRLKVMLDETKESIGYKLLPVATKLAQLFLGTLVPAVAKAGQSLAQTLQPAFDKVREAITKMQPVLERVAQFVKNNPQTVKVFAVTLIALATALGVVSVAVWAVNTALAANPIGIVVVALAALAAGLYYAYTHSAKFRAAVDALGAAMRWLGGAVMATVGFVREHWRLLLTILIGPIALAGLAIAKHWDGIRNAVVNGVSAVIGFVRAHWRVIVSILTGPIGAAAIQIASHFGSIKRGAESVVGFVRGIPGKLRGLAGSFGSAGRALISAFVNGMKNAAGIVSGIAGNVWSAVERLLNGAIDRINAALSFTISIPGPDIHVNAPNIPHLAKGGVVTRPTLALIGEDGPEAVVPLGAKNRPRGQMPAGGGVVININGALDPVAVGRQVEQILIKHVQNVGRPLQVRTM
jgi:phage-related protein